MAVSSTGICGNVAADEDAEGLFHQVQRVSIFSGMLERRQLDEATANNGNVRDLEGGSSRQQWRTAWFMLGQTRLWYSRLSARSRHMGYIPLTARTKVKVFNSRLSARTLVLHCGGDGSDEAAQAQADVREGRKAPGTPGGGSGGGSGGMHGSAMGGVHGVHLLRAPSAEVMHEWIHAIANRRMLSHDNDSLNLAETQLCARAASDTAGGAAWLEPLRTLEGALRHRALSGAFQSFLERQQAVEDLFFWQEACEYRRTHPRGENNGGTAVEGAAAGGGDDGGGGAGTGASRAPVSAAEAATVAARARLVYECFIGDDAPHQVAVSGDIRERIEKALSGSETAVPTCLPVDIFDTAAAYAFSQLQLSQWPQFQASVALPGSKTGADFDHLVAVAAATATVSDSRALDALLREREGQRSWRQQQEHRWAKNGGMGTEGSDRGGSGKMEQQRRRQQQQAQSSAEPQAAAAAATHFSGEAAVNMEEGTRGGDDSGITMATHGLEDEDDEEEGVVEMVESEDEPDAAESAQRTPAKAAVIAKAGGTGGMEAEDTDGTHEEGKQLQGQQQQHKEDAERDEEGEDDDSDESGGYGTPEEHGDGDEPGEAVPTLAGAGVGTEALSEAEAEALSTLLAADAAAVTTAIK